MSEDDKNTEKKSEISINEKTIEVLIARLIPTSQYFEVRFDTLEQKFDYKFEGLNDKFEGLNDKFDQLSRSQENLKTDMDKRFEEVSRSQENLKTDMNKRFEQVDKRFEQVSKSQENLKTDMDKRFEQVDLKLDKIIERIDRRIDEGLRESRGQTFRLFTFAMPCPFPPFPWWACSGNCSTCFSMGMPLSRITLWTHQL